MATPANPQSAVFKDDWLPGPDGTQFYTRTYAAVSSARAVVVFVHGFSGHCARYEWMHGVYATRGITVFAFDQRGFGRTALDAEAKTGKSFYGKTSWREQLDDIDWWVKHVKDQYPALPVFLMGHSMVRTFSDSVSRVHWQETAVLIHIIVAFCRAARLHWRLPHVHLSLVRKEPSRSFLVSLRQVHSSFERHLPQSTCGLSDGY